MLNEEQIKDDIQLLEPLYNPRCPFITLVSKCDGITKKKRKCTNNAMVRSTIGDFCNLHIPKEVKVLVDQKENIERDEATAWEDAIADRIKSVYTEMAFYRKVPPPEDIVYFFLKELQSGQCFMCWAQKLYRGEDQHLVEDHCHETGMVRSLLCRGCNTLESKSSKRRWDVYRRYAPANGLFYRYFGWGEQWRPGDPDPLSTRITFKDIDACIKPYTHKNILSILNKYKKKAPSLTETKITKECGQKFDRFSGNPQPLDNGNNWLWEIRKKSNNYIIR